MVAVPKTRLTGNSSLPNCRNRPPIVDRFRVHNGRPYFVSCCYRDGHHKNFGLAAKGSGSATHLSNKNSRPAGHWNFLTSICLPTTRGNGCQASACTGSQSLPTSVFRTPCEIHHVLKKAPRQDWRGSFPYGLMRSICLLLAHHVRQQCLKRSFICFVWLEPILNGWCHHNGLARI